MKRFGFIIGFFILCVLSGCETSHQTTTKEKITTSNEPVVTATEELSSDVFVNNYQDTLTDLIHQETYAYQYMYRIGFNDTIISTTTDVFVDNQSKNVKMTTIMQETVRGNTKNKTVDTKYISEVGNHFYLYYKDNKQYIANAINEAGLFWRDNKDIATGIFLADLEVVKVNDYEYSIDLPFESMNINDQLALGNLFESFGVKASTVQNIHLPINYKFNRQTNKLETIEMDMSGFIRRIYPVIFPNMNFNNLYMVFVYTIKDTDSIAVVNPYKEEAIYDDAPNQLFDTTLAYPSYGIEDINCSFEYIFDTDVYEINVSEDGKYILNLIDNNYPSALLVYDDEGSLIVNATADFLYEELSKQNPVAYDLTAGTYYISATYFDYYLNPKNPMIKFTKVDTDDYADTFYDETKYPVKIVTEGTEIEGKIDYIGDVDVFKIEGTDEDVVHVEVAYDDLMFNAIINQDHITYKTYDFIDGGYDFCINFRNMGTYYLVLSSNKEIKDYHIKITYYNESTDEADSINDANLPVITVNEEKEGAFHKFDKFDAFEFTVTESSYYNIYYENISYLNVTIYNQDKEVIDSMYDHNSFYFEPGTYYLMLETDAVYGGLYKIMIEKATDDVTEIMDVTLGDMNIYAYSGNYIGDVDTFRFTVTEKTIFKLSAISDIARVKAIIIDSNGVIVNEVVVKSQYVYLIPGQYTLNVECIYWGDYSVQFDKTDEVTDDYPEATSFEDEMGILKEGDNTISFDYTNDVDMYMFDVQKEGKYFFINSPVTDQYYIYMTLTKENGDVYHLDGDGKLELYLEAGKYYFSFSCFEVSERSLSIIYSDPNIPDEPDLTEINIFQDTINGQINYVNDEDTYQFTVENDGLLKIDQDAFYRSLQYQFLDAKGNVLINHVNLYTYDKGGIQFIDQSTYVELTAGIYQIKVIDKYNSSYPYTISFSYDTSTLENDDPGVGTFNFGDNTIHINYKTDIDVYELSIDDDMRYTFTSDLRALDIYFFDQNNNFLFKGENIYSYNPYLQKGTYYLKITSNVEGNYQVYLSEYSYN